jgi:hypothetical protein
MRIRENVGSACPLVSNPDEQRPGGIGSDRPRYQRTLIRTRTVDDAPSQLAVSVNHHQPKWSSPSLSPKRCTPSASFSRAVGNGINQRAEQRSAPTVIIAIAPAGDYSLNSPSICARQSFNHGILTGRYLVDAAPQVFTGLFPQVYNVLRKSTGVRTGRSGG